VVQLILSKSQAQLELKGKRLMYFVLVQINRNGRIRKRTNDLTTYPNGNGSKIPFYSRIGTKLIVGFLIIASITGTVGYLSFNYSQIVGEKFHLLVEQSLPSINSLEELKVAGLEIEVATLEYVFTPGADRETSLQELTDQKIKFNENLEI
jgi:hypothetical protein